MSEALRGWGDWHRSIVINHMGYSRNPLYRDYIAGHTRSAGRPCVYVEEEAMAIDKIIAKNLSYRHVQCLLCEFCFEMSTRQAANYLTSKGLTCNKDTYVRWRDTAIACINGGHDEPFP
jgi:hypothetical protein